MSAIENKTPVVEMTPEQQGVFYDFFKRQIPGWLLKASAEVRGALYTAVTQGFKCRDEALVALNALQSPEAFCTPLLEKALFDKLGTHIDVAGVMFQHVRSTDSLWGMRKKLILPIHRELLAAACENFEKDEELASNYHVRSLIYIPERVSGKGNEVLSLQPNEFAALCRSLDLGKRYRQHVESLFTSASSVSATPGVRDKWIAYAQINFQVDMHLAYLQGHISLPVYEMLKLQKADQASFKLGNNNPGLQKVTMKQVLFHGVMFIGPVTEHADDDYRCVMYVPGDPLHPLKEYSSFTRFEAELSGRLKTADFKKFFLRFIALEDRANFDLALDILVRRPKFTYVQLEGSDVVGGLFIELYRQRRAQLLADTRMLVVPTADKDEATRLTRIEQYKTLGLNALVLLLSFAPFLREAMFAVSAAQLLMDVYEGVDAWSRGEQDLAADYLFSTVENMILAAVLSSIGTVPGKSFQIVRGASFVQRLRKVTLPDGSMRLWKPSLRPYRQPRRLASGSMRDERGLIMEGSTQFLPIEDDLYAVEHLQSIDKWQLQHPSSQARYQPVLETNGAGAWRHDSELPTQWSLTKLLRRSGIAAHDVPDAQIDRLLVLSGLDETALRQIYVNNRKLPALLMDVVHRISIDKTVNAFIDQLNSEVTFRSADADLQLYLLTLMSYWPQTTAISIVNTAGRERQRYGQSGAKTIVTLTQAALRKGDYHASVLDALTAEERQELIRTPSRDAKVRVQALVGQLVTVARKWRQKLFLRLYQRTSTVTDARSAPVAREFPALPAGIAEEMTRNADIHEWQELERFNVPLRLAEQAQSYLRILRINRAYEGLYLDSVNEADTNHLVLDALSHLPGWPADHFVQIMDWANEGYEARSIGPADASSKTLIDVYPGHLQASDSLGNLLADHPQFTRALYFQTLWEGLPKASRVVLGVAAQDNGETLREKLIAAALARHQAFAQRLEPGTGSAIEAMGGASARQVAPSSIPAPVALIDAALVQRAEELYPLHTRDQINRFLVMLGSDDVLRTRKLEALRLEYQKMHNDLTGWVNLDTRYQSGHGPRISVPRHSKLRAARAITQAWRKESEAAFTDLGLTYSLSLPAEPLGDIPVIVADFGHVTVLDVSKVGASAGLTTFLHNFKNVRTLNLSGNELIRLPTAIEAMTGLTHLDLSDNLIRLTADSLHRLIGMANLRVLNLSFNPQLTLVPDVSRMVQLEHLALRGTGIGQWPTGIWSLHKLVTLDARDNAFEEVPEALFASPVALHHGVNLYGNPLSATALQSVAAHQSARQVNVGIVSSSYRHSITVVLSPAAQRSLWLTGVPLLEASVKQGIWDLLAAIPESRDFFDVLTQMRVSADFSVAYSNLQARVWDVVQAAGESERLRRDLFNLARAGRVTGRDYLSLFSALEVDTLYFRAVVAARSGVRTLEGELMHLLRGLFRLQTLERHVQADIATRSQTATLTEQEGQQLSLAYRVGLAERLNLPAQPTRLNRRLSVDVTNAQLDDAYRHVVRVENTDALTRYIRAQPLWIEYLRSTFDDRYIEIDQRFAAGMGRLEAQVELSSASFSQRMKALFENFKNDRQVLFNELTRVALTRNPGLALPEVPVAVPDNTAD